MALPEIWGHRGARGLFPENTLAGIEAALRLGVAGVETDIAVTRDGVPVLSHDPRLSPDLTRDAEGAWVPAPGPRIRDLSLAELRAFDVGRLRPGSPTAALFPGQRPIDGARVPTLTEVLALGCKAILELKTFPDRPEETVAPEAMAEAVAQAVVTAGAEDRVIVESFDWRGVRHMRRLLPKVRLAWLTRAETEAAAHLWWQSPPMPAPQAVANEAGSGGGIWAPEHGGLTADQVKEAHMRGVRVIAWTVNAPAEMLRLAEWGVDGIITDRPDIAVETLRTRPPPR